MHFAPGAWLSRFFYGPPHSQERSCLATGLTETPARPASDPAPSAIFAVRGALLLALLWMGILGGGQLGPLKPTRLALRATTPGTTAEGGGASQRAGNSAAVLLAALLFLVAHPTAAVAEGRIVWAFVTDGHPLRWPILVNAVAHAERALAQRADDVIWVVCADERSLRACVRLAAGKPVVLCRDSSDFVPIDAGAVAEDERTWGGEKWTTIVNHIKPAVFGGLIGELVGTSPPPPNATRLCVLDSDLVIRSDPAPLVVKWPIVISTESLGINSGFVCVDIGSKPAVAAFQKYSDTCARSNYTVWEQVVMSSALAGLPPDVLRTVFWADGFDHFCRNPPQDSRPRPNEQGYDVAGSRIVIHAACLFGSVGKQKGLKDVGAWDEDAVSKFPLLARRRR